MELESEVMVQASPDAAWAIVGEQFGQIGQWAAPILDSSLDGEPRVGAVRDCQIAGFGPVKPGVIRERLIAFDPASRSFTYEALAGMPAFVAGARNRWSVAALDAHRCVVRTHATLTLRGPMRLLGFLLARRLRRDAARVLEELRHRIEQGSPHPRKLASLARGRPDISGD